MQTEENSEEREYADGLAAGTELSDFGIGTIQTAIEGMDWSGSYIAGIWDGRLETEEERESAFYKELIKETEAYQSEKRLYELNALQNLRENQLTQER